MTHEEQLKIVQLMKDVYRGKAERSERQFEATFNIACDLLRAIESLYGDGSNVVDVSKRGGELLEQLRAVIEMPYK
jgi:hypothetical protein